MLGPSCIHHRIPKHCLEFTSFPYSELDLLVAPLLGRLDLPSLWDLPLASSLTERCIKALRNAGVGRSGAGGLRLRVLADEGDVWSRRRTDTGIFANGGDGAGVLLGILL